MQQVKKWGLILFILFGVLGFFKKPSYVYWIVQKDSSSQGQVLGIGNGNGNGHNDNNEDVWFYTAGSEDEAQSVSSESSSSISSLASSSSSQSGSLENMGMAAGDSSVVNLPKQQVVVIITNSPTPTPSPTIGGSPNSGTAWITHSSSSSTTTAQADSPPRSPDQTNTTSSSSQRSTAVVQYVPEMTSTPYPTRSSGFETIFNSIMGKSQSSSSPPILPSPTQKPVYVAETSPTPVPKEWKGGIFIMPTTAPSVNVNIVNNITQQQAKPIFVPGKEIASIEIKTPAQMNNVTDSKKGLDVTVNKKTGEGLLAKEDVFTIRKAMQTISITADSSKQGNLSLSKNDIAARIAMAIQIDPLTNSMSVDTPFGTKRVSIMPDDAVDIIRELHIIEANIVPGDIVLETHNNQLAYKIQSSKIQKLLGFIPVTIPKQIFIAADTGGLIEVNQSPLYNIVTLFTF